MGDRAILHSDMNSFYASVEQAERPELRGLPVVVAGKEELRHGIVLAKSIEAKAIGIKTAETLREAREKCPGLIVLPPNYALYKAYSRKAREIYYAYTDRVEPFGLDEAWLDLTGCPCLEHRSPTEVAEEVRKRVFAELGVTVSIGVSWNKVFAKFGSDYRKPDAVTEVSRDNYREIVWTAPVEDLLYVGPATKRKLNDRAVRTIGELAGVGDYFLKRRFGAIGFMLRAFARGEDATPVKAYDPAAHDVLREIKSYGNGLTAPHDIANERDAKALLWILGESVAQRLREGGMRGRTVSIGVRWGDLSGYGRQTRLWEPTCATRTIVRAAWGLLAANEPLDGTRPIRALHVRVSGLVPMDAPWQGSLWGAEDDRLERLDLAIDGLRGRFGNTCIRRGVELADPALDGVDIKSENTVHPVGFLQA